MSNLYTRFLRGVALPLGDWMRGVPIGQAMRVLNEAQWWPAEKVKAYQAEKLRRLVRSSFENIAYVRDMMQGRGLKPEDIQSADDLVKLPLLTKQIIRENYPERITHRGIPESKLFTMRTGGSTGEPVFFKLSRATRAWDRASYYRYVQWCGSDRAEVMMTVWGQLVVADRHSRLVWYLKRRFITREFLLDAFTMTPATMRQFADLMHRLRPAVLRGYTSALVDFGRFVEQERIAVPPLKALSTTAEQILPEQREFLERVFSARLFDQYGCAEVGGAAYECESHSGLHVAAEHCIIEIVDEDGRPMPPGVPGMVALTNLDNEATPFIRYLNGDMAATIAGPCPCGRGLPLMSSVTGRTSDMIYGVNGTRAHGEFFTHLLNELGLTEGLPVREFQVVQTHKDRLQFKVVSDRPASEQERQQVVRRIRDYLGDMVVEYEQVERIDRTGSGKRRFTLRLWNPSIPAQL